MRQLLIFDDQDQLIHLTNVPEPWFYSFMFHPDFVSTDSQAAKYHMGASVLDVLRHHPQFKMKIIPLSDKQSLQIIPPEDLSPVNLCVIDFPRKHIFYHSGNNCYTFLGLPCEHIDLMLKNPNPRNFAHLKNIESLFSSNLLNACTHLSHALESEEQLTLPGKGSHLTNNFLSCIRSHLSDSLPTSLHHKPFECSHFIFNSNCPWTVKNTHTHHTLLAMHQAGLLLTKAQEAPWRSGMFFSSQSDEIFDYLTSAREKEALNQELGQPPRVDSTATHRFKI